MRRPAARGGAAGDEDVAAVDEPGVRVLAPRQLPTSATVFRWASLAVAVVMSFFTPGVTAEVAAIAAATAVALAAAVTLLERRAYRHRGFTEFLVLVALAVIGVLGRFTGGLESPYLVFAFAPLLDAGFLAGMRAALILACVAALIPVVSTLGTAGVAARGAFRATALWGFAYCVAAATASYARSQAVALASSQRRLASERRQSAARLATVEDANSLLTELHRVAQVLPATLDPDGLVEQTLDRMQEIFPAKVAVILMLDGDRLRVLGSRGALLPVGPLLLKDVPSAVELALERPIAASHLPEGAGVDPAARSILYVPLLRESQPIGLLLLEDTDPNRFGSDDIELLEGFAGPVAVSLENARLFGRLRTLATSEERARIARELHDRTAQQLAAIAFELDVLARMARKADAGSTLAGDIDALAVKIRSTIEDLRNAIGNLRTDVTEAKGLSDLLREFCPAVAAKNDLNVTLDLPDAGVRLPLPQERELWRICQEAISNVAKHAQATNLHVRFHIGHENADLCIEDDGTGFDPRIRKLGHFGLAGMAERAEAIGAQFGIEAPPEGGTAVRVTLRRRP